MSTPSVFNEDLTYAQVGKDISCNLGSLNIAKTMDSPDFAQTIEVAIRALTAVSRPDAHLVGAVDRAGQQRLPRYRAGADEPARISGAGADLLRLRRGCRLHQHLLLHGALSRAAGIEPDRDRARLALQGLREVEVRVGGVLRQVHRAALGAQDRQGAPAVRRCRHSHSDARGLGAAQGVGAGARHLQPEPAGGPADRLDQLHQPLDVIDPPGREQDRDPQGRQDRPGVLPGAVS